LILTYRSQLSRLKKAQEGQDKILVPKKSVPERWNSTVALIEREILLQPFYISMQASLSTEANDNALSRAERTSAQHYLQQLERVQLTSHDVEVLKDTVRVLKPFQDATNLLSGQRYVTASVYYPAMVVLHGTLKRIDRSTLHDNTHELLDRLIELCETRLPILAVKEAVSVDRRKDIENNTAYAAYSEEREMPFFHAVAVLLDPRFKSFDIVERERVATFIRDQVAVLNPAEPNPAPDDVLNSFLVESRPTASSEWDTYTGLPAMRITGDIDRGDPLRWWKRNATNVPKMAKLARIYLCATASSVPCEELFSASNDVITKKRNRLLPNTAAASIIMRGKYNKELRDQLEANMLDDNNDDWSDTDSDTDWTVPADDH